MEGGVVESGVFEVGFAGLWVRLVGEVNSAGESLGRPESWEGQPQLGLELLMC